MARAEREAVHKGGVGRLERGYPWTTLAAFEMRVAGMLGRSIWGLRERAARRGLRARGMDRAHRPHTGCIERREQWVRREQWKQWERKKRTESSETAVRMERRICRGGGRVRGCSIGAFTSDGLSGSGAGGLASQGMRVLDSRTGQSHRREHAVDHAEWEPETHHSQNGGHAAPCPTSHLHPQSRAGPSPSPARSLRRSTALPRTLQHPPPPTL